MNIARPATGFVISEPADYKTQLQKHVEKWPRVFSHWDAVKDRLKMTAHREGVAVGPDAANRVYEAEGDAGTGLPTLRLAYKVLGDQLVIKKIAVIDPPVL